LSLPGTYFFWEDEILEFIRCCCATAVDGSIPLNGIVVITAAAHTTAVTNTNRYAKDYSSNLLVCIKYTCTDVGVKL